MDAATKRALIVFVKAPMPGDVKTRLIPYLTSSEAADLYRCFVTDTLMNSSQLGAACKMIVAYQSHPKAADLSWLRDKRSRPDFFRQEGKSLGERLIHSFGIAFGRGARHVVVIGSDSPNLPSEYIKQAFEALENADVVLGPAADGGYYLVGLSRPCLHLFDEVVWSTDQMFEQLSRNTTAHRYSLRVLPHHYDVDTIEDLNVLRTDLCRAPNRAPATHRFLTTTPSLVDAQPSY